MPADNEFQNYITELRRGSLTVAVLGCLDEPHYGYALLEILKERKIEIEANSLYPLLRRLENQGLLVSNWDTKESRPRKYYAISKKGKQTREKLVNEWKQIQKGIEKIYGRK